MALRNQPYIPLYVQDFLTDEKLVECSASTTGVYIRLMCIMHKSERYGTILLKQNDKQSDKQIKNFATKLVRSMPYSFEIILAAISELLNEKVVYIEGDFLCQGRMIKDNSLSEKRAKYGKDGGDKTAKRFAKAKVKAKPIANTEYEDENEIEDEILIPKEYLKKNHSIQIEALAIKSGLTLAEFDFCITQWSLKAVEGGWDYTDDKGKDIQRLAAGFEKWLNTWVKNKSKDNGQARKGGKTGHDISRIMAAADKILRDAEDGNDNRGG